MLKVTEAHELKVNVPGRQFFFVFVWIFVLVESCVDGFLVAKRQNMQPSLLSLVVDDELNRPLRCPLGTLLLRISDRVSRCCSEVLL